VAAALSNAAPQGLLVEFQKNRPYQKHTKNKAAWGLPRYLALLLRPNGTIRAFGLGEAAPIDAAAAEAVAEAVAASADPNRQLLAPQKLAAVSRLVLAPLQRELAGVRELYVSPDGELNRLPFAALPYGAVPVAALPQTAIDGETLGDAVALRLITTGRELLRLRQPARAGGPAVLIANPTSTRPYPALAPTSTRVHPLATSGGHGAGSTATGRRRCAGPEGAAGPAHRHPWFLFGGTAPGERRRKGRGGRSVQPRRARPAAPQRPGVRRRQPPRCRSS
jgi:hypothetical protein